MINIEELAQRPITHEYKKPSQEFIDELKSQQSVVEISPSESFVCYNAYLKKGFAGADSTIFTRKSVLNKIQTIATSLKPHGIGLYIFDAFRSRETQLALFNAMKDEIKQKNPHLSDEELLEQTKIFVSDPFNTSKVSVPPHNSGGAIDLALFDISTQQVWEFGSGFDDPSEVSQTNFFEQKYNPQFNISQKNWELFQRNRRILFHLFCDQGFINYECEWWHYDLGDARWVQTHSIDYLYKSMEDEVQTILENR